ncbi:SPOR domain-containing protein [Streptomyces sp. NPDC006552]|uniref:SPOR domain-containing protein n=1 Tax=Streptomyces sp. NPDC006552 TaxID=3157179 RepID=UPI0033B77295
MNDGTTTLPWLVIREDDNGNRYRVGRFATRAEAQRTADSLGDHEHQQLYCVERLGARKPGPEQNGTAR